MKLNEVGEERIVEYLQSLTGSSGEFGIGDDGVIIDNGANYLCLVADAIKQGTHIYKGMSYEQMGRKAVVCNFSDLAAMGAKPNSFLLCAGISKDEDFEHLKEILRGAHDYCRKFGTKLMGGDTINSETLFLAGFASGLIKRGHVMTRRGARPGDIIAVTGCLGSAACGWQVLEKGLDLSVFDVETRARVQQDIILKCLEPEARVAQGLLLADSRAATSCIDISDGLAKSLHYLRNDCGFEIDADKVLAFPEFDIVCDQFGLDKNLLKYSIGEDFELLFTVKKSAWDALYEKFEKSPNMSIFEIGCVTEGHDIVLLKDGSETKLKPRGYDSFSADNIA